MEDISKALFLIELAESLLTTEMQRSRSIGPDKINRALIGLTKVRVELDDCILQISPHDKLPAKVQWAKSEPLSWRDKC